MPGLLQDVVATGATNLFEAKSLEGSERGAA